MEFEIDFMEFGIDFMEFENLCYGFWNWRYWNGGHWFISSIVLNILFKTDWNNF